MLETFSVVCVWELATWRMGPVWFERLTLVLTSPSLVLWPLLSSFSQSPKRIKYHLAAVWGQGGNHGRDLQPWHEWLSRPACETSIRTTWFLRNRAFVLFGVVKWRKGVERRKEVATQHLPLRSSICFKDAFELEGQLHSGSFSGVFCGGHELSWCLCVTLPWYSVPLEGTEWMPGMTALRQSCSLSGSSHITIPVNGTFHSVHSPVYSRLASENSSIRKALRYSYWVCGLVRDEQTGMQAYFPPQDGSHVIVVSDFFLLKWDP